ncbi:hypothetical protein GCM10025791_15510 [Halioxenophilus aromaticivorans]|uniref:Uncharacterized protein n=1 Tax=Halioxenophilus aromaticivorans TaxID=1306992 RepID=A0AAV3U126_9ALTE
MLCGKCGNKMELGEAAVRYTGWGIFFFGASYKHLFYKPKDAGPNYKVAVIKNNQCATAYRCESCGTTTILNDGQERNLIHW